MRFMVGCCALALMLSGSFSTEASAKESVATLVKSGLSFNVVEERLKRYVPVDIGLGKRVVTADVQPMLGALKRAADSIDKIYWRQVSSDGASKHAILNASSVPAAQNLAALMQIHYGIWDRHQDDSPFLGARPRNPGATFYPADLSRREFEGYINTHLDQAEQLYSPYTLVRREGDGLKAIAYSTAYREDLAKASAALRMAASQYRCNPGSEDACPCASFVSFLEARSASLLDDDYRSSEYIWMDARSCPLDMVIGPYEYYEDRLAGLKTSYEAIVIYRDETESKRFQKLQSHHDGLFNNLPLSAALRRRIQRAKPSPINIADALYAAGDARAGTQVRAVHLPNDEVVRRAKGSKKVILRNVVKAKFDHLIKPVARHLLNKKALKNISFDAYFNLLLTWQMAHSLLPANLGLTPGAKVTTRQRLKERYTIMNSLRGEAVALVNYFYLLKQGAFRKGSATKMATTYLATLFDSARLAAAAPQTIAKTIIFSYLREKWVFRYNPKTQTFEVNPPAMEGAVRQLAEEAIEVLTRGDYDGAGRLIVDYGIMPAEMRQKLVAMRDLPTDIRPTYVSMGTP